MFCDIFICFTMVPVALCKNINRKPDTVFTVNFVFAVLGIVGSALAIICSGLFFLLGIGMALPYDDMTGSEQETMSFVSALLIVVSIILLINSVISLIYSIAKAKFFSSAKKSMFSDRVYPSGAVYGIFSIIQAAINLLVCLGTIFFGFVLYNSNEFATDITALSNLLPFIAISRNIPLIIIIYLPHKIILSPYSSLMITLPLASNPILLYFSEYSKASRIIS